MDLPFWKYQGTGNDFVMLYDPEHLLDRGDSDTIARICHRRFGIGADGLICADQTAEGAWFMQYYNSDGRPSSFCGNGGRCFARFLQDRGLFVDSRLEFYAVDGAHEAILTPQSVHLRMRIPYGFEQTDQNQYFVETGSPHIVQFITQTPDTFDLIPLAHSIRYNDRFKEAGVNVNIAYEDSNGMLRVRTYERGVEDETWSCGTGVTAVATVYTLLQHEQEQMVQIFTPGGQLSVHIRPNEGPWLIGPAVEVFHGVITM